MATIFSTSDDIYVTLVEESEEHWLFGLVAFAVIEEQRIEWAKHYEKNNGRPPDPGKVRDWYDQQPENARLRAKGDAEGALRAYSDDVVESFTEEYGRDIEEDIVVREIRSLGRFWPQFGVNLVGGFTSALIFAAILTIVAFLVLNDASPVQLGQNLKSNAEVINDGKE